MTRPIRRFSSPYRSTKAGREHVTVPLTVATPFDGMTEPTVSIVRSISNGGGATSTENSRLPPGPLANAPTMKK